MGRESDDVSLPPDIQAALGELQKSVATELQRHQEELALLSREREQVRQQAVELAQYVDALQQQKDLADSELVHIRLDLKQSKEKLAQLEEQVAGEPTRQASLREALQHEARLSSQLTLEVVDLKLALEATRYLTVDAPIDSPQEKEPPHLNLPAEIDDENKAPDLHTLAYQDLITGLPNFRSGLNSLSEDLDRAGRGRATVAVVVMDVERLRDLNVFLGHPVTNQVLQLFALLVKPLLAKNDKLIRGRDDEFWLILPTDTRGPLGLKTASEYASELLKRIYQELETPLELEDHRVTLSLASGVVCSQGKETGEAVLDKALLAVAAAKKLGHNRVCNYVIEMERPIRAKMELIPQLRQALNRSQFELRFQPIWDLAGRHMKAVECLLRWQHPTHGLIEPSGFLEVACESGLIVGIGEWVAYNVCHLSKSYRHLQWCLNVSAQELMQADFVERLSKAIESAQLSKADGLVIEVCETHLVDDSDRLLSALKGIRHCKVGLAIDDFSFDALSLRRLQSLGANYLKLGSHITQSVTDPLYRSLVRGAVLAANSLGCKVIAEGIENQAQLDLLTELGCHWGQGYFLCAPIPLEELDEKLKTKARL